MLARKYNIGNVIMFGYNSPDAHDKNPKVLILNPDFQGELHGINLNLLDQMQTNELIKLLPNIHTMSPQTFYFSKLRMFLKGKDIYRKYQIAKISNSTLIKKSLYMPGVGGVGGPSGLPGGKLGL